MQKISSIFSNVRSIRVDKGKNLLYNDGRKPVLTILNKL